MKRSSKSRLFLWLILSILILTGGLFYGCEESLLGTCFIHTPDDTITIENTTEPGCEELFNDTSDAISFEWFPNGLNPM